MKTAIWKLKDIHPAPYNPRVTLKPGDTEWESLDGSIGRFGLVEPLVINERTGLLVSGHQTLNVLKAQKKTEAEVVLLDIDEADEKLLNIALNKIDGEWDYEKLEALFDEIKPEDIQFTGFSEEELANLFDTDMPDFGDGSEGESGEEEPEEKKAAEEAKETKEDAEQEFNIFLSFPTKEAAEAFLEERGVELKFEGTARNITIRMEGLDYGTGN